MTETDHKEQIKAAVEITGKEGLGVLAMLAGVISQVSKAQAVTKAEEEPTRKVA